MKVDGNKMRYETTAQFSTALVRRVANRFLRRFFGLRYLAGWLVLLVAFISLILSGASGWLLGTVGTALALFTLMTILICVAFHHRAMQRLAKLTTPEIRYTFDEECLTIESRLAMTGVKWSAIEKMWVFPEAWLLFVDRGQYVTIPAAALTKEMGEFIKERLKKEGKIVS